MPCSGVIYIYRERERHTHTPNPPHPHSLRRYLSFVAVFLGRMILFYCWVRCCFPWENDSILLLGSKSTIRNIKLISSANILVYWVCDFRESIIWYRYKHVCLLCYSTPTEVTERILKGRMDWPVLVDSKPIVLLYPIPLMFSVDWNCCTLII